MFLLDQHSMFAQGGLSSPAVRSYTPPASPCRPKARLLPSGGKPGHGLPPLIRPHLLAPPCRIVGAWENYPPALPLLQSRVAFCSGQGKEPKIPSQRHHSLGLHGRPAHTRHGPVTTYLPPPDRLPTPGPGVVPSYARLKLRAKQLLLSDCVTGAPYREVNSKVATAPNTQSRR